MSRGNSTASGDTGASENWGGEVMKRASNAAATAHVLMIPHPAQPHIVPMLQFARQLCSSHSGISVTFVSFQPLVDRLQRDADESRREGQRTRKAIRFVGVPDDLPGFNMPSEYPLNPSVFRMSLLLGHNMGPLLEKLKEERQNSSGLEGPTCMLVDVLSWWTVGAASKLGIPRYILSASPACFVLTFFTMATDPVYAYAFGSYDAEGKSPTEDHDLVCIPTLPTFHARNDFPVGLQRHSAAIIRLSSAECLRESDGVLINTFYELESEVIEALRGRLSGLPVLAVGPLAQPFAESENKTVSLEGLQSSDQAQVKGWLDQQPDSSVLYISFGTTGMFKLSKRHVQELARSLMDDEIAGSHRQRFLWVLRAPPDASGDDDDEFLPPGFEAQVAGRGLLVRGWAPQLMILAHPAVGAFLSPCGWNSSIESISFGVPIIAWPTFAEQPITARYLVEKVGVAIALKCEYPSRFVDVKEFRSAFEVMFGSEKGKACREKTKQFQAIVAAAQSPGGSSYTSIQKFHQMILGE